MIHTHAESSKPCPAWIGDLTAASSAPSLIAPNCLREITATFGDIAEYVRKDGTLNPTWERDFMTRAPLPFSVPLSGTPSKLVSRIYCHRKLAHIFPEVFCEIESRNLRAEIRSYGGCFAFRNKRSARKFSTHCWGIAIDLNPESNQMGNQGDMSPAVVEIFRSFGFKWGGDWIGRSHDPMHFQFCTGY